MSLKLAAIALLFAGETLTILAELIASRNIAAIREGHYLILILALLLGTAAVWMLVFSYVLGYDALKNIWIITAISIGSIIVFEPILTLILFRQVPTTGAAVGLVLGIAGIISALSF